MYLQWDILSLIDVCTYLSPCRNDDRSVCRNVPGGHVCDCIAGFIRDDFGMCNIEGI